MMLLVWKVGRGRGIMRRRCRRDGACVDAARMRGCRLAHSTRSGQRLRRPRRGPLKPADSGPPVRMFHVGALVPNRGGGGRSETLLTLVHTLGESLLLC